MRVRVGAHVRVDEAKHRAQESHSNHARRLRRCKNEPNETGEKELDARIDGVPQPEVRAEHCVQRADDGLALLCWVQQPVLVGGKEAIEWIPKLPEVVEVHHGNPNDHRDDEEGSEEGHCGGGGGGGEGANEDERMSERERTEGDISHQIIYLSMCMWDKVKHFSERVETKHHYRRHTCMGSRVEYTSTQRVSSCVRSVRRVVNTLHSYSKNTKPGRCERLPNSRWKAWW